MELKPARTLGKSGKLYRMPEGVAGGTDEVKKAWAIGVFMGAGGGDTFETKDITVSNVGKTYEKLEIHDLSPQMYAALNGSVAIPTTANLDGEAVTFYKVSKGEAIILDPKVWHGGPTGIDVPATVLVVLKEGTTEHDTKKANLSSPVRLGPC